MQQERRYTVTDREFWKISVVLGLGSFFIFACLYAVQPLLPVFVNVFHISVSESSLSLSLTIVGLIIGLNVLGLLSDRYCRTFLIRSEEHTSELQSRGHLVCCLLLSKYY